jgi:hypothetical protein
MRSQPRQLARITINTGGQSSFWQAVSKLQSNTCAHCSAQFCAQVWRRAAIAVVAASRSRLAWTISWLGFGLSDHLLFDALSLEKGALPFVWLSSLGFASGMILCQG